MEKGIEAEEDNLYNQTEDVADNVLDALSGISPNINSSKSNLGLDMNYNKLFNLLYDAFSKALTNCKFTLDDDGFARIVKDEIYKVV